MGGRLDAPGVRLFGETVIEKMPPEDYDRLRSLHMAVYELETHITQHEVALGKGKDEDHVASMRRRIIADSHARIKTYRAEIRELDEGWK